MTELLQHKSEPWTGQQGEFAQWREQKRAKIQPLGLNAYIWHEGTCNSFGQNAYAVNALTNQSVVATIREKTEAGLDVSTRDYTVSIAAGSRVWLGCTFYDTSPYDTRRYYDIVGSVP